MVVKVENLGDKKRQNTKKDLIQKLSLKFPRVEREDLKALEEIDPESGEHIFKLGTLNEEGFVQYREVSFERLFGLSCLEHVIYRTLKAVYGYPDPLTVRIVKKDLTKEQVTAWPLEWGYMIDGGEGSRFEISRQRKNSHCGFALWLKTENPPEQLSKAIATNVSEFLALFFKLSDIFDNDYSIKAEVENSAKIFRGSLTRCVANVYYQNFQAGKDLLELWDDQFSDIEISLRELRDQARWLEAGDLHRKGSVLLVSAVIRFIMAMEGLVNLLYRFFLRPQMRDKKEFKEAIQRLDLEMLILHLPVYCSCFGQADFNPDDAGYKAWLKLRSFRNNLLHANVTEENEFVVTVEDWFLFQYNVLFHSTGKQKKRMHTQQIYIRRRDVLNVQQDVETFVSDIVQKIDEKERAWVTSWLDNAEIWFEEGIDGESPKPIGVAIKGKEV